MSRLSLLVLLCVPILALPATAPAEGPSPELQQVLDRMAAYEARLQQLEAEQHTLQTNYLTLKANNQALKGRADLARHEAQQARQEAKDANEALAKAQAEIATLRSKQAAAAAAAAAAPPPVAAAPPPPPVSAPKRTWEAGLRLSAEALYVHQASIDGTDYASRLGNPPPPFNSASYTADSEEYGLNGPGGRARLEWATSSGWVAGLGWTGFWIQDGDTVDGAPGNKVILGNLLDPDPLDPFQGQEVDWARQTTRLRHHTVDLDLGRRFALTDDIEALLFGGLRGTRFDLHLKTQYQEAGNWDLITEDGDFWGAGVRLGGILQYAFGDSGLSVYAAPSYSLLYAKHDLRRRERQYAAPMIALKQFDDDVTNALSVLEGEVGVRLDVGPINLTAGYLFQDWIDGAKRIAIDRVDTPYDGYTIEDSDLTYGAAFLRAGVGF